MSLLGYSAVLCSIGALVLLDKWTFGEFGVSQPIVSCPLLGLIFGDFSTGLYLGVALQLIWVEALPLGGSRPLDYQSAGITGIVTYLFARQLTVLQGQTPGAPTNQQVLLACLILAAAATLLGRYTDHWVKRINDEIYDLGMKAKRVRGVFAAHFLAFVPALARGMLMTSLALTVLWLAWHLLYRLPEFSTGELLLCPLAIGIASLARLFYTRQRIPLFAVGVILSGILWVFWR